MAILVKVRDVAHDPRLHSKLDYAGLKCAIGTACMLWMSDLICLPLCLIFAPGVGEIMFLKKLEKEFHMFMIALEIGKDFFLSIEEVWNPLDTILLAWRSNV